jgi:DNA-binding NarL/FixJ family response regulator
VAIRLVIAEDNLLVREGVERLLDLQPDIEVASTQRRAASAAQGPRAPGSARGRYPRDPAARRSKASR